MRADEFSKMRALENANWWFRGRRQLLRGLIRRLGFDDALILDAGCGTGFARRELDKVGTVIGLDTSPEAFALGQDDEATGCIAVIEQAPFENDTFDLAVALDLLEHLEDDHRALAEIYRVCKPGGYLFATVPACQWIWSRHDEVLGHRRRYSAADLGRKVREAGFAISKLSYVVTTVFPLAAAYRLMRRSAAKTNASSDLFRMPEPANSLLAGLMNLESRLAWHARLPFGLTAFVLASKAKESDNLVSPEGTRRSE